MRACAKDPHAVPQLALGGLPQGVVASGVLGPAMTGSILFVSTLALARSVWYCVACGQAMVLTGPAAPYSLLARL